MSCSSFPSIASSTPVWRADATSNSARGRPLDHSKGSGCCSGSLHRARSGSQRHKRLTFQAGGLDWIIPTSQAPLRPATGRITSSHSPVADLKKWRREEGGVIRGRSVGSPSNQPGLLARQSGSGGLIKCPPLPITLISLSIRRRQFSEAHNR
jgi:hypothetical protein